MLSCCDLRASDILVGAPLEILVIGRRECISKLKGGSCNIFCFWRSSLFGKQIVTLIQHKKVRKCNKKRPFMSGVKNNGSLFKFLHNGGNRCICHTFGHPSTFARPIYERLEIFDFLVSKVWMVVRSAWFGISSLRVISSCANEVINRGRVFTEGARSRYKGESQIN